MILDTAQQNLQKGYECRPAYAGLVKVQRAILFNVACGIECFSRTTLQTGSDRVIHRLFI